VTLQHQQVRCAREDIVACTVINLNVHRMLKKSTDDPNGTSGDVADTSRSSIKVGCTVRGVRVGDSYGTDSASPRLCGGS
jgi:hypothetical protein